VQNTVTLQKVFVFFAFFMKKRHVPISIPEVEEPLLQTAMAKIPPPPTPEKKSHPRGTGWTIQVASV